MSFIISIFEEKNDMEKNKRIYELWKRIKQRCYNENHTFYKNYGGRGIKVFDNWISDYRSFESWILNNLGEKPEGFSLDRIDNDGNYEPGNLRWADRKTQNNNQSTSLLNKFDDISRENIFKMFNEGFSPYKISKISNFSLTSLKRMKKRGY